MKSIGITGGVGAGKSRILEILRDDYNAEIIAADDVSHTLIEKDMPAYNKIISVLGRDILDSSGAIDKKKMAEIIFNDSRLLNTVNSIIHPIVWDYIKNRIRTSASELIVVETALMRKEQSDIFDEIWYVYTSKEERIKRLMSNRGYSMKKCNDIMNKQLSDSEFRSFCTHEIDNNKSISDVKIQIKKLMSE